MSMNNPHSPEKALWDAYIGWMDTVVRDPHNTSAKESADYYYDQWEKQTEKRVTIALKDQKIKETAGDKMSKVKPPKADRLSSK